MGLFRFVARRAPVAMPKKTVVGPIPAFSSRAAAAAAVPPLLRECSPLQRELSPAGLTILTLVRHLAVRAAAAEPVHSPTESRHGGFQGGDHPRHEREPEGFHGGGGHGSFQLAGDGSHSVNPGRDGGYRANPESSFFRGGGDVPRNPPVGLYHRGGGPSDGREGTSGELSPYGLGGGNPGEASCQGQWRPGGFRRGPTQGHSPGGAQQDLWGCGGGKLGEALPGVPIASPPGRCGDTEWNPYPHGGGQLDRGIYGFPASSSGEVQQDTGGDRDSAGPAGGSKRVAEASCFMGTVDELDGFLEEGKVKEAAQVLVLLKKQGIFLDLPRYLKLLDACGEAKALEEARLVHYHILPATGNLEVKVHNRILDMYCKCGSMDDALQWFDQMPERNFTSWDIMIMGLADNGLGEDAIDFFNTFLQMGLRPDGRMFVAVFHACCVLGAVDEGMLHFESMSKVYGIIPTMEHYVSIVDMLGQTGYLDEAAEFIEMMPCEPSVDVWEVLMNCCRLQGNVEVGDRCAEMVGILDPSRLTDQCRAGLLPVKDTGLAKEMEKKKANILEVRCKVHEYRAGDTSHPEKDRIYGLIRGLAATLRESGYVPDTRFVLHDIDQESKEAALLAHSERLATAYGLISSAARSPIRIIKNLRTCGDCHSYMKIVSKLVGRELVIRDAKRFHHFKDGVCSCRDYW